MRTRPAVAAAIAAAAAAALGCHEATHSHPIDVEPAAATITAADMRSWIERLAHDSLRGRDTPSAGIDKAAQVIEARFIALGLRPFFPTGYVQRFPWNGGTGPNVAAVLEGRDPTARHDLVILVAHLDGKGVTTTSPVGLDSIRNGADDNASGVAAVLELAEAMVAVGTPPRRSVVFLLVSAEEYGLIGSRYFVARDTSIISRSAAAINFDMISRNAVDSLLVGGITASTMGEVVRTAVRDHPTLGFRLFDPGRITGSDHTAFWEKGVPFLFFFTGLHPDYHTVVDEASRVDADKAARVARLGFYVSWAVAEARERPAWASGWP
jgi:hypothetical protein